MRLRFVWAGVDELVDELSLDLLSLVGPGGFGPVGSGVCSELRMIVAVWGGGSFVVILRTVLLVGRLKVVGWMSYGRLGLWAYYRN